MRERNEKFAMMVLLAIISMGLILAGYFLGHAHGVSYALENMTTIQIDENLSRLHLPHDMSAYFW